MCLSRTGNKCISVIVPKWSVFQNTVTIIKFDYICYDMIVKINVTRFAKTLLEGTRIFAKFLNQAPLKLIGCHFY